MGAVPKEPFSLWMMLREPGREVQELPAAFGSGSVAKLLQEVFVQRFSRTFPREEAPGADSAPCVPSRL